MSINLKLGSKVVPKLEYQNPFEVTYASKKEIGMDA